MNSAEGRAASSKLTGTAASQVSKSEPRGSPLSPSAGGRDTKPLVASVAIRAPLSVNPVTEARDRSPRWSGSSSSHGR